MSCATVHLCLLDVGELPILEHEEPPVPRLEGVLSSLVQVAPKLL